MNGKKKPCGEKEKRKNTETYTFLSKKYRIYANTILSVCWLMIGIRDKVSIISISLKYPPPQLTELELSGF